jgi:hypothetical protein
MAYNRINLLRRIVEIQDITLEHKKKGATQLWIYHNLIADRFKISISSYNRYLSLPAKRELRELQPDN